MTVEILAGDCLDVLATLPENSVDAVVTDPPYHLTSIVKRFGADDAAAVKPGATGVYERSSRGFMGKTWDGGDIAMRPETWAAVLRVLKPGGHLIALCGTRTEHRVACAIEDAGFEIRDRVLWLYGTGFPKSHDVSKGIDRAGGISPREQAAMLRAKRESAGMSRDALAVAVGCTASSVRDWEEGRARATGAPVEWIIPSAEYRARLAALLGYSADERRLVGIAQARGGDGSVIGLGHTGDLRSGGHTDAAREWAGWGTALKPAVEIGVLARKPLSEGTVAANVLRWGTGALNIDATRIHGPDALGGPYTVRRLKPGATLNATGGNWRPEEGVEFHGEMKPGRWPANVAHDGSDEVLAHFPDAPGQIADASSSSEGRKTQNVYGAMKRGNGRDGEASADSENEGTVGFKMKPGARRGDSGSAARFFYCAKAGKADRANSKHPTVKPIALMRWLVRMVVPPGGVVLDPFAGSGTTGQAAIDEGFGAILIEREAEYLADIRRRFGVELSFEEMLT